MRTDHIGTNAKKIMKYLINITIDPLKFNSIFFFVLYKL